MGPDLRFRALVFEGFRVPGLGLTVVGLEFGACLWFRVWVGGPGFRSEVEGS